jgi:NADH:ubiquinone oxidoreductase subunit B-like Fe-S oxidoreductase
MTQPIVSNQTGEVNQQLVIIEHVTTEKMLKEIIRNINKQVLETKYILNLGQLL